MKKVGILIENLFDEQELIYPYHRLREDYEVVLIGTEKEGLYKAKSGFSMKSDLASSDIKAEDLAALFIPGGFSPDFMRRSEATKKLVADLDQAKKPLGAICHGGWMLAESADIKGKKVTSFMAIKTDLENAGGKWVDQEVVVDENIITGRTPKDLPAVIKAFIKEIEK